MPAEGTLLCQSGRSWQFEIWLNHNRAGAHQIIDFALGWLTGSSEAKIEVDLIPRQKSRARVSIASGVLAVGVIFSIYSVHLLFYSEKKKRHLYSKINICSLIIFLRNVL